MYPDQLPQGGPLMNTEKEPRLVHDFVKGGRATFTIKSVKTGVFYSFSVTKARGRGWDENNEAFFVSRKGAGNSWIYLGMVTPRGFKYTAKTLREVRVSEEYRVFEWFWSYMTKSEWQVHPQLEVFHQGKCGVCGKDLTDPLSIQKGMGPVCRSREVPLEIGWR